MGLAADVLYEVRDVGRAGGEGRGASRGVRESERPMRSRLISDISSPVAVAVGPVALALLEHVTMAAIISH